MLARLLGLRSRGEEQLEDGLADILDLRGVDDELVVEVGGEDEADSQVLGSHGGAVGGQAQGALLGSHLRLGLR